MTWQSPCKRYLLFPFPNSAPFRGRVVERSVERSETEGLISPQKKLGYYKSAEITTSALPPRNDKKIPQ